MFEKLVVSTTQRRRGRTSRFFLGTVFVYMSVVAGAFSLSVALSSPQLADSELKLPQKPIWLATASDTTPTKVASSHNSDSATAADYRNPKTLTEIIEHPQPNVARTHIPTGTVIHGDGSIGDPDRNAPNVIGVIGGDPRSTEAPPRPPDPPKPATTKAAVEDTRPLRVTSSVLQGKALEKRTPIYPPLAKQIHMQGDVSVEVIIAPDGRVESARVVSGHPMFSQVAKEAALGWRFGPTLLNNVPVRVTGVIVFVFKFND